jgi:hypothetical protein
MQPCWPPGLPTTTQREPFAEGALWFPALQVLENIIDLSLIAVRHNGHIPVTSKHWCNTQTLQRIVLIIAPSGKSSRRAALEV